MAIGHLGDISSSGFPRIQGFFSELDQGGSVGESLFTGVDSSTPISSGECVTNAYSSGRFDNVSGACLTDEYSSGKFEGVDGAVTVEPYQAYGEGPFSIYGNPTHETPFNFMKDFYTIDKINQEYMQRASSRIIVARLDREETEVDPVLGEASGHEYFKKGIAIYGIYELNPIIQELSKFGISEDEDIIIKFNYTHLIERLGRPLTPGDMMAVYLTSNRLTEAQLAADQKGKDYYVRQIRKIYRVNTAVPKDLFLYNYLTIECNCTKTNLDLEIAFDWEDVFEINDVPDDINQEDPNPVPIEN